MLRARSAVREDSAARGLAGAIQFATEYVSGRGRSAGGQGRQLYARAGGIGTFSQEQVDLGIEKPPDDPKPVDRSML